MNIASEVLVIILSIFLALFLLLSVILLVHLIKISKQISDITASFQRTTTTVEDIVTNAAKLTSPMLIFKAVVRQFNKHKKGEKDE
jgi:cell division protein FtsB